MRALRALALGVMVLLVVAIAPASAHPLGNFTVNTYGGLELSPSTVTVHYVVDMAEIPTFQERDRIDTNHDGNLDAGELHSYSKALAARLEEGISITAGSDGVTLEVADAAATLRPGEGGLKVLRIEASFSGPLPADSVDVEYHDSNYARRIGWKEIVAYATGGQGIVSADVPSTSVTHALDSYPKDRLSDPIDVDSASVTVRPGAAAGGSAAGEGAGEGTVDSPGREGGALAARFTALIGHDISLPFLAFALLLAFAAGALHALGPGHGKSIMAAYLVGTEGRLRHALIVGVAVSLMHTASVVVLGLLILGASRLFTPEAVFPWLSLASGVVVLALGAWLLRSRVAMRRAAAHAEAHEHGHRHGHSHGGHTHSHEVPAGVSPTSWKGLGVIALSGGLLPSPSALVVLLGAVALHRVFFGVVLVATFSIGLAAALTAVGLLVIKARSFAARRYGSRITVQLPVLSAAAIFAIGLFLTAGAAIRL
jgi:nickel/cobalt transporter (NicO) family protein